MARGILHFGSFGADTGAGDVMQTDAFQSPPTLLTGTADAISFHTNNNNFIITTGSADLATIAAPVKGADDNLSIAIYSSTAFAHTLTSTGNMSTGSANVNKATFAAFAGAGVTLRAYQGKWQVIGSTGITFS
jgi:hypothetical protein